MKKALITGVTGQDGSYLSELLLSKGYQVNGLVRRASTFNTERIDHIKDDNFILHHGDITDSSNIRRLIDKIEPDEVYNLGAMSHVGESFTIPLVTAHATGLSSLILLDSIKEVNPKIKYYQASTSELFGGLPETAPQNEDTPMRPMSPYACAKLYSYWITKNYRDGYGIFASNGILFNHESPRRTPIFVTRKITYGIAQILAEKQDVIKLGNMYSKRDWGFSFDYVEAMYMMMQHHEPLDLVIATGETHTVKEFIEEAFRCINIDIQWRGEGVNEEGYDAKTGKIWIKIDPRYFRPLEVEHLEGDYSRAKNILGWTPKTNFKQLVNIMMKSDLEKEGVSV